MDLGLDDEQQMVVQTVRRFVEKDVRAWADDADRAAAVPERFAAVAGDLGFFLDAVPESAGGMLDGAYRHVTRALRGYELARGCAAMAALIETNVEPALAVGTWGSDAAKAALFASLTGGGLATTARDARGALEIADSGGGGGVHVSGAIGPVPALGVASHVLLLAKELVALLPVEGAQPITPNGWRAAKWGTLACERAAIPADHVLARGDAAAAVQAQILAWYKASLAARAAGVAAGAMEHAAKYAADRVQFGQPIGTFEAIIRLRDDGETNVLAARLMALHAAWMIDQGDAGAADAASRARVLAGDVVGKATIDAVQILGGYGFVNDFPVEKLMRDARAFDALLGDERFDRILARKA